MIVYLNGTYLERGRAAVSVDDRGFLFGDGVYEVIRAQGGRLFEPERHLRRLARGLDGLGIAGREGLEPAALIEISRRLLVDNGLTHGDATVYLQVTRGVAERTHHFPPPGTRPTVFLAAQRLVVPDEIRTGGATAITTDDLRWGRCDLKTVQLVPNVLAKERAVRAGAFEAILVRDGVVTEGASANLFAVIGDVIRTHPADHQVLPGITREIVLELCGEHGFPVSERPIARAELADARELFLTGTTIDVMPVVRVDARAVGDARPGPIARRLHAAIRALVAGAPARAAR